jgi:histone demethylase JARID1
MENTHANEALEALDASNGGDHSDAMRDDDSPDTGVDGDMNGEADAEDTPESS